MVQTSNQERFKCNMLYEVPKQWIVHKVSSKLGIFFRIHSPLFVWFASHHWWKCSGPRLGSWIWVSAFFSFLFAYEQSSSWLWTLVLSLCSSPFPCGLIVFLFSSELVFFLHTNVSYSLQWPQVDGGKDIVFRFIIEYSSLRDFGP